ncbi:MAG: hypothetical protein QM627_02570 [Luteolibacter sp.]
MPVQAVVLYTNELQMKTDESCWLDGEFSEKLKPIRNLPPGEADHVLNQMIREGLDLLEARWQQENLTLISDELSEKKIE